MPTKTSDKNPVVELLLCIFLGMFGAHRFYMRKWGTAILYLLTGGIFYIGWIVDIILIIIRLAKKAPSEQSDALSSTPRVSTQTSSHTKNINNQADALVHELHEQTIHKLYGDAENAEIPAPSAPVATSVPKKKPFTEKTYKIQVSHHIDNVMALADENPDYDMTKREIIDDGRTDEKIWQYLFSPRKTELLPEPDNPHDKNAIKVIVDGKHVGYIKAGSCAHLLKVIRENRVRGIDCTIGGGQYKIVYEEYDEDKEKEVYTMDESERNYFVTLTVYESNS